jgi:SAM-dependent methyltransferase
VSGPGASPPLPPEVLAYYARGSERDRLAKGHGPLEQARTQEIIARHLPAPPAVVMDVGGGPGTYALWLAGLGHTVHLVDASALHVEQAQRDRGRPLASARVGDARALTDASASADVVLLLGPLYHLVERHDRRAALAEASRVLRPAGVLVAVGISRFASLLDGVASERLGDLEYGAIVRAGLRDGQHRNPTSHDYFTTAYFHRPEDLEAEVLDAGFSLLETTGIEGPGWMFPDVEARWRDPNRREELLAAARWIEHERAMLGTSAHIAVVARRPA